MLGERVFVFRFGIDKLHRENIKTSKNNKSHNVLRESLFSSFGIAKFHVQTYFSIKVIVFDAKLHTEHTHTSKYDMKKESYV